MILRNTLKPATGAALLLLNTCGGAVAFAGTPTTVTVTSVHAIGGVVGSGPTPFIAVGDAGFDRVADPTVVGPNQTPFILMDACHGQQVTPVHANFGGKASASATGGPTISEGRSVDIGAPAVINALAKVQQAAGQNQHVIEQWLACDAAPAASPPAAAK